MSDFFEAAVPEPYTVLGLHLKPLSPGHLILLRRVESPFLCGGPPSLDALILAVWICHLNYTDGLASLCDKSTTGKMAEWQKKVGAFNYVKKASLFLDYIKEGRKEPIYDYKEGDFDTIKAPLEQVVLMTLLMETNFTEAELLDRPWRRCLWDYITIKNIKGHLRLVDKAQLDALEQARLVGEHIAKIFAKREQKQKGKKPCRARK